MMNISICYNYFELPLCSYTLPAYVKRVYKKRREQAPALRCIDIFLYLSPVSHLYNKCIGLCPYPYLIFPTRASPFNRKGFFRSINHP